MEEYREFYTKLKQTYENSITTETEKCNVVFLKEN